MGRKWATGGTRTSRAGVKAGLPTPGLRGQLRPSKPYPNPEISLSLGPLSPAQAVCCRSRPRRARGQKGLDTHLGPWRRRWLLHGPPPHAQGREPGAGATAQLAARGGTIGRASAPPAVSTPVQRAPPPTVHRPARTRNAHPRALGGEVVQPLAPPIAQGHQQADRQVSSPPLPFQATPQTSTPVPRPTPSVSATQLSCSGTAVLRESQAVLPISYDPDPAFCPAR